MMKACKLGCCLIGLMALLLACCSVKERLDKAQLELGQRYDKMPPYETLPVRRISWNEACRMVEKNNLEIKQLQQTLQEAKRNENSVFRNLVPAVNLGYYYTMSLFGDDKYSSGRNGEFNINVIFSLPELVKLPVNRYKALLATYRAEQNIKLKRRELIARLYQYFREEELMAKDERLEDDAVELTTQAQGTRALRHRRREVKHRERWHQLCTFFNDYSARWKLHATGLPRVSPEQYRQKIKRPGDVNLILAAMELEASRLRKLGIAVNYWPSVQVSFYSPTLFNATGGNLGGFMNAEDVRLNMNSFLSLDTRLTTWDEYKNAKAQHQYLVNQLQQKMYEHREKMALLMRSWDEYLTWRSATLDLIEFRRSHGVATPEQARSLYDEDLSVRRSLLDQERKNLERECALIQEYGMP